MYHECEDWIEKSDAMITVRPQEACRVIANGDSEGQIFLSGSPTNTGIFSCSPLNSANTVKPQKFRTQIFRNTRLFKIHLGYSGFRELGLFVKYFNNCQ